MIRQLSNTTIIWYNNYLIWQLSNTEQLSISDEYLYLDTGQISEYDNYLDVTII